MGTVASRTRSVRGRTRPVARRTVENELRRFGFGRIAGVDEVGRGHGADRPGWPAGRWWRRRSCSVRETG